MCAATKRRACAFDMAEVSPEGYVLADEQGEMYFCIPDDPKKKKELLAADHALW